jgi:predicted DsbA family dithiol-disulfide isomerase
MNQLRVEIWSDILCPFCYIGKRHFETALAQFPHAVNVRWRSFELNPHAPRDYDGDLYDMLAEKFRTSRDQARIMNGRVLDMARRAGLHFDLDRVRPTNSFDAHRLIHLAARHGRQGEAEEKLFAAYFVEGKHVGDHETLETIGRGLGLEESEVRQMLYSDAFAAQVRADEEEARQFGITGVPFFVFNRKFAVSGAQPVDVFLKALDQARKQHPAGAAGSERSIG